MMPSHLIWKSEVSVLSRLINKSLLIEIELHIRSVLLLHNIRKAEENLINEEVVTFSL